MDEAVPRPRTIHRKGAGVSEARRILDVLDESESRADREAVDRGVHEEPDPASTDEEDDVGRLEQLLGERCSIARERTDGQGGDRP